MPGLHMIGILETALGRRAEKLTLPTRFLDDPESYGDIGATHDDFGFEPTARIEGWIPKFVNWYLEYHSSRCMTYKSRAAS